ncbi:TPA: hypothetical protein PXJ50_003901 [Yersinia enterocolitica]|nr:hypothetical protein [Yersinia enterocolitica]HDL6670435.1 hypothetical protein [Yersinia enterocolitica]HDL6691056.1 hypothetical protein [Yersinia enterocolitica]HDL6725858.1 hypothetical protein [Yersinia enterocolitica]HDL6735373.1 hypothetical protein [Yersinia enterocolitica]
MFQQSVKVYSGVGQAGQPASNSPIIAAAGGPGAFQAGASGLIMSRFAWRNASNPLLLDNTGTGKPVGFIYNNANATIGYLQSNSMTIPAGREASPVVGGDFWTISTTVATVGQKVFANLTTGLISTGAAGATVAGSIETDWYVASPAAVGDLLIISTWSKA